jgi:hypothetical protein
MDRTTRLVGNSPGDQRFILTVSFLPFDTFMAGAVSSCARAARRGQYPRGPRMASSEDGREPKREPPH